MVYRLKLLGIGGQGIVFMGWILGYALNFEGKYVALHQSYGSEVRGTPVYADIVFNNEPVDCPYTREFDLIVALHQKAVDAYADVFTPRTYIIVDKILVKRIPIDTKNIEFKPFVKIGEREKVKAINMIVLGYLAKKGLVKLESLVNAVKVAGKNIEENERALRLGYTMT